MARGDPRIVAGAFVGSQAHGRGDRWSDIDLTFGVADGVPVESVLEDWTTHVVGKLGATALFDVHSGSSTYRVFLLPGCLQCDLSFTPSAEFGAIGPNFRLLFGHVVERPHLKPQPAAELFGHAVHDALRARFSIERGRLWQSEYFVAGVRNAGLELACRRHNLPAAYARGYDDLPANVQTKFAGSFAKSLEAVELRRAMASAITNLLNQASALEDTKEMALKVRSQLQLLIDVASSAV